MRIPQIKKYDNKTTKEVKKLTDIIKIERHINLMSDKDKIKFIKQVEMIVRSSQEYRQYVDFLKKEVDMTHCAFFNAVSNANRKRVSIEIHHEPFTLFDITQIVLEKWINEDLDINPILIAEEIARLHYANKVGLIPVSITVHELVHVGKLFIPIQTLYGDFIGFLESYVEYVGSELQGKLELKVEMSNDAENQDRSILEKKYIYIEVDGYTFPQPVSDIIEKQ